MTWSDYSANGTGHAQIFDPRGSSHTWSGSSFGEQYFGTAGGDTVSGQGGNDTLKTLAGNDILNGGTGADYLDGGDGVDFASYADAASAVAVNLDTGANPDGDTLVGIEGVIGSAFNDVLAGSRHALQGGRGDDVYNVGAGTTIVEAGGEGRDTLIAAGDYTLSRSVEVEVLGFASPNGTQSYSLFGSDTANEITGNRGKNMLSGYGGNDKIAGGLGNDTLLGGTGQDIFIFNKTLSARTNKDMIRDFSARDDTIWLENSVFTKVGTGSLTKPKMLTNSMFWAGTKAHDASDRIVYNKKTGALYYDPDGTGSKAQVQFATLTNKTTISAHDFYVI